MKKQMLLTTPIMLLFLSVLANNNKNKFAGANTYAVIIGVSRYNDPAINPLKFAHKDAEMYKQFLQSPKGGAIPEQNIALLTNEKATRGGIMKAIRDIFKNASDEDVIIFYYSGHGVPDPKIPSDLYFTTYDTEENNYVGTALYKEDIVREFNHNQAKLKLFLVDACHSGGSGIHLGIKDDGADLVNKLLTNVSTIKVPGWAAITASSSAERSYEDTKWGGGHGIFTYAMINGLQGEADKTPKQNSKSNGNSDGIVTARELYDYLNNIIPAETGKNQHPDIQGQNESSFPLSAVSPDKYSAAVKKYTALANTPTPETPGGTMSKEDKPKLDLETKQLAIAACTANGHSYGQYEFISNMNEDILFYAAYGTGISAYPLNVLIAPGESGNSTNLHTGYFSNMTFTGGTQLDCKFYFRTVDETKPIRYGTLTLNLEACKLKKLVISKKNLYLSSTGEKY